MRNGVHLKIIRKYFKSGYIKLFLWGPADLRIKVPHAFQDILGTECTPTLPYSIPAFSAFIARWRDLLDENPDWYPLIEPGLEKLKEYEDGLPNTPAYIVAMGMLSILTFIPNYSEINYELLILEIN